MTPPWPVRAIWFCFGFFTGTRAPLFSPANFRLDAIFENQLKISRARKRMEAVLDTLCRITTNVICDVHEVKSAGTWIRCLWRILLTVSDFWNPYNEKINCFIYLIFTRFFFSSAFRDTGSPAKFVECLSCGRTFNPAVLVGVVYCLCK